MTAQLAPPVPVLDVPVRHDQHPTIRAYLTHLLVHEWTYLCGDADDPVPGGPDPLDVLLDALAAAGHVTSTSRVQQQIDTDRLVRQAITDLTGSTT